MISNNTGQFSKLAKKASLIFAAAMSILAIGKSEANQGQKTNTADEGKTIEFSSIKAKVKPMPVLKLNMNNPELSRLVASHGSHSSHSSHSSHRSSSFV